MSEKLDFPREEVEWYPRIDYDKCISCGSCLDFCPHDVYAIEEEKVVVKNPYNCVVGCQGCQKVCEQEAISFPSRDWLKQRLRELREKYSKASQAQA